MLKLAATFASILIVAVMAVWLLMTNPRQDVRDLGSELGKLTGQVALVTLVGGVLVQEYSRRHQQQEALNEFRKSVLRGLVRSYTDAKSCRRLLRARCRVTKSQSDGTPTVQLSRTVYEERMGSLNDTQLELEILVHDLNTFPAAFAKRNEIRGAVSKMEHYLNTLITEYEHALREVDTDHPIELALLPRLSDFIHGRKDSLFRRNFTSCFYRALSMIQAERLL